MYYSQNITISATQPQKPLSSRRHSSILSWNLTLRRINSELRFRRYQRWHRHTTLQHPHWPPSWQPLQRPRTGTAWAGILLPQPHPSLTQLSVLPGCARALTTNHPSAEAGEPLSWATLDKTAHFKLLPCSLETLTPVPPLLWGWGQQQQKKERFYPLSSWSKYQGCSELYLCREHETNTRRWGRTSSQWALILKFHWYWFMFFGLLHWKETITELWIKTHFCTTSGWTPHPPALNHSQAAGNPREGKANLKSPRYAQKFQKMSKIHWMTKSHDSSRRQAHLHHLFVCRGQCLMFAAQMDENLNLNYSLTDYKFPLLHERNI